jgi:hypothetical protein
MRRLLSLVCFSLVAAGCAGTNASHSPDSTSLPPNALVLRVEALDVRSSPIDPSCPDNAQSTPNDQGLVCVPFHYWFTYRVRVSEVIEGSWSEEELTFSHLQHTNFTPDLLHSFYVVLKPATATDQPSSPAPFVAVEMLLGQQPATLRRIRELRHGI